MVLIFYLLILFVALLLQTHPLMRVLGPEWHLDMSLLVATHVGLFWGGCPAILFGFVAGLALDLLSSDMLGLHTLSKTLIVFVVSSMSPHIQPNRLLTHSAMAGFAVILDTFIRWTTIGLLQPHPFPLATAWGLILPHALLGMILMPLLCWGLCDLEQRLRNQAEKGQSHASP